MNYDDLVEELDRRRAEVGWRRDPNRAYTRRGLTVGKIIDRLHALDEKRYKKMNLGEIIYRLHVLDEKRYKKMNYNALLNELRQRE